MKKTLTLLLLSLFFLQLTFAAPRPAKVEMAKTEQTEEVAETQLSKKELRREHKKERIQKRWKKIMAKVQKKQAKKPQATKEVWDDGKFRLGVIFLGAAIALGIVSIIISLGGLLNFIAGLFALAGVVFLVWSLVEYYS